MRVEKGEIEGSLMRDKEEVRALQRRMQEAHTEIEMVKLDIEKAKKEAKQQKGLLAIAKKQLSSKEAERAKAEKELEEAKAELAEAAREREAAEAQLAKEPAMPVPNGHARVGSPDSTTKAAQEPLPLSPDVTGASTASFISPMHTGKSNNPFDRLAMSSSASSPRSQSPFAMPFSNAPIPSPIGAVQEPSAAAPHAADPFGFSQAFETDEHQAKPAEADVQASSHTMEEPAVTTPRATPAALPIREDSLASPTSPTGTDFFSTPPTTATALSTSPKGNLATTPNSQGLSIPGGFPSDDHVDTDLTTSLQEREVDESDSDSDDDDDEVPLSTLANKGKAPEKPSEPAPPTPSAFDDAFADPADMTDATPKVEFAAPPFGAHAGKAAPSSAPQDAADAFGTPFAPLPDTFISSAPAPASQPAVNGVNEFDEALGKLPSSTGATPAFTFDSAFDDNFDFPAPTSAPTSAPTLPMPAASPPFPMPAATPSFPAPASAHPQAASAFPPVPTASKNDGFDSIFGTTSPAPAVNGHSVAPTAEAPAPQVTRAFSFDDAFGDSQQTAHSSQPSAPSEPTAVDESGRNISFSDAFGSAGGQQALALSDFGTVSSRMSGTSQYGTAMSKMSAAPQFQPPTGPPPGNLPAMPTSPLRGSSTSVHSAARSTSPGPRAVTPPPRHQSPRPRPSASSSSKDAPGDKHDKQKDDKPKSRLSVSAIFQCTAMSAELRTSRSAFRSGRRRNNRKRRRPCPAPSS